MDLHKFPLWERANHCLTKLVVQHRHLIHLNNFKENYKELQAIFWWAKAKLITVKDVTYFVIQGKRRLKYLKNESAPCILWNDLQYKTKADTFQKVKNCGQKPDWLEWSSTPVKQNQLKSRTGKKWKVNHWIRTYYPLHRFSVNDPS